ncbi:hypothetical protein EW146_g1934 [Bondarzewia mesenterica]|uniref:Uncharacterized protein n=1 Tax=Bondarzewia mesenterica TaxID=1095465 RepID=A0A4S4M2A1_9AGAM|nr:hypothetical protein EW146_g1934 [Bondarzewia mesenterica]
MRQFSLRPVNDIPHSPLSSDGHSPPPAHLPPHTPRPPISSRSSSPPPSHLPQQPPSRRRVLGPRTHVSHLHIGVPLSQALALSSRPSVPNWATWGSQPPVSHRINLSTLISSLHRHRSPPVHPSPADTLITQRASLRTNASLQLPVPVPCALHSLPRRVDPSPSSHACFSPYPTTPPRALTSLSLSLTSASSPTHKDRSWRTSKERTPKTQPRIQYHVHIPEITPTES